MTLYLFLLVAKSYSCFHGNSHASMGIPMLPWEFPCTPLMYVQWVPQWLSMLHTVTSMPLVQLLGVSDN